MESLSEINKARDLSEISEIISQCKRCELYKTKIKDVPGFGNKKAEILFIGEAPGKKEDIEGEPFVGQAGKFLSEMLESIGLTRSDVFIANVVKHRPPRNRAPLTSEKEACLPYLRRQIELINPKIIVLLGKHAMTTFLPELKISEAHGKIKNENGKNYLPLYHPAAALYNGSLRETLKNDFTKIQKILETINKK